MSLTTIGRGRAGMAENTSPCGFATVDGKVMFYADRRGWVIADPATIEGQTTMRVYGVKEPHNFRKYTLYGNKIT